MSHIYQDCTVCHKSLSPEDILKNEEEHNVGFTICLACVEKGKNRTLEILLKTKSAD